MIADFDAPWWLYVLGAVPILSVVTLAAWGLSEAAARVLARRRS